MLYFSSIGNKVLNLEQVTRVIVHSGGHCTVFMTDGSTTDLSNSEWLALQDDIHTACTLVKLQQESGERDAKI